MAGVLAGVPFVVMPWVVNEAWLGHLSQLWMAPMFCAAGCLHQVFHVPEDRHAWRNLALWTVLAALTYWIYGLLLALLGVLVLACHVPRLSRPLAGRLLAAVLVTVGLLGPLADFQFSRELVLREAAAGGITASTREAALKRAMGASVCLGPLGHGPDGRPLVRATPLGSWLPGGFLALGLALVLLEWRDRSGLSAWLLAALFFAALGLGPYLQQGGALLGDRAGNPVLMPFQYLVEGIPPLTRWSLPSRAVPMAMFCLCAALAVGLRRLDGRSRPVRAVAALLACALAGAAASWMTYHPEPQRSFTPARIPEFCRFLERQPRGAVVDLPLGFAGNAWQLQMLHHQPAVQGAQPLPRLVVENAWLREVHGWNWKLVPGATPELAAAALRSASYLPYGTPRALRLAGFYGSADAPRGREGASSLPVLRHALAQLRRLGVRYLVLHRANCGWIAPAPGEDAWRAFRKAAGQHFGGLLYEDAEAAVFALPPTVRLEGPPDAGGGEKDQGRGNPRP